MTIKEFIEAAIEGGWEIKNVRFSSGKLDYDIVIEWFEFEEYAIKTIVLDPESWKAVGKVKGWDREIRRTVDVSNKISKFISPIIASTFDLIEPELYQGDPSVYLVYIKIDVYKVKMLEMIAYIAQRHTLEEYIATL